MEFSTHRKRVKHYHQPGELHELTFSCYHRMPLLSNDDWRLRLSRHVDTAGNECSCELVAFVFMPEHKWNGRWKKNFGGRSRFWSGPPARDLDSNSLEHASSLSTAQGNGTL